jgi:hypothetical protein
MSRKSFRHIFFGFSILAVTIGFNELPANAGTQNAAIANSTAKSSSALGSEPIEVSTSSQIPAAGARVSASIALPELIQPNVPETSESTFLTQRMLLAQSTTSPSPLPPRQATPYETNPDTNPNATPSRPTAPDTTTPGANSPGLSPTQTLPEQTPPRPVPPRPVPPSPTDLNPSAPPPIAPGDPAPPTQAPGVDISPSGGSTPPPAPEPPAPGTDRTPPGTFNPDTNNVSPGRATRSGSSYIGIGGNIGLGSGNTALGEGSFSVFSKVGLTSNVSVRPGVLVNDNPTILLPVTLDFTPRITGASESLSADIGRRVSPFIGAGIAISTANDASVDFLATVGVDVAISRRFTGTAAVNATLFDNPAVGLQLGIGYNF